MTTKRKHPEAAWSNIVQGMEDYIFSIEDDDIRREDREDGVDTQKEASALRESMLDTVRKFKRRALDRARDELSSKKLQEPTTSRSVRILPPQERRALLRAKLERQPSLTAQFRQFEEMTDDDVLTALEDLAYLEGLIDSRKKDDGA